MLHKMMLFYFFAVAFFLFVQWTVPKLSIMIIYNSTILIQYISIIFSGDNLT